MYWYLQRNHMAAAGRMGTVHIIYNTCIAPPAIYVTPQAGVKALQASVVYAHAARVLPLLALTKIESPQTSNHSKQVHPYTLIPPMND